MADNQTTDPIAALDAAQKALDATVTQASPFGSQPWSAELIRFLAMSLLAFTLCALLLGTLLLWRSKASASQVLRIFGILSIIGVSAFLLVVGYSNEQLTPIVGLFGAIAGYLLGKETQPATAPDQRRTDAPADPIK